MKKKNVASILVVVGILLIAGIIIYSNLNKNPSQIVSADAAKWIGEHSTVYVQAGCSHCADQEAMFGDNWKYMNSIDCIANQQNTQTCINANITGTPTWVINGQQYIGVQSISTLENLTGYQQ